MVKYAPDMDDQNLQNQKPQLSLEEELDVLEAVYKIGMEKGLELLRPEQVKKLEDAGRVEHIDSRVMDSEFLTDNVQRAYNIVRQILHFLEKYKDRFFPSEEWDGFDKKQMRLAREKIFSSVFKMRSKDFGYTIFLNLTGTK